MKLKITILLIYLICVHPSLRKTPKELTLYYENKSFASGGFGRVFLASFEKNKDNFVLKLMKEKYKDYYYLSELEAYSFIPECMLNILPEVTITNNSDLIKNLPITTKAFTLDYSKGEIKEKLEINTSELFKNFNNLQDKCPTPVLFSILNDDKNKGFVTKKFGDTILEFVEKLWIQNNMNPKILTKLMIKIAERVIQLHEHDIVHRDLKEDNILIRSTDTDYLFFKETTKFDVVLIDLGLSCRASQKTCLQTASGTSLYMNYKYFTEKNINGSKMDDVYAVAVIFLNFQRPTLIYDKEFKNDEAIGKYVKNILPNQIWKDPDITLEFKLVLLEMMQLRKTRNTSEDLLKKFIKILKKEGQIKDMYPNEETHEDIERYNKLREQYNNPHSTINDDNTEEKEEKKVWEGLVKKCKRLVLRKQSIDLNSSDSIDSSVDLSSCEKKEGERMKWYKGLMSKVKTFCRKLKT